MPASDFLIVGAGILGLATARALLRKHPDARITVLEKEAAPGRHASGRNSGVLHSGIFYRPGTWKARFCVQGAAAMLAFAQEHGIPWVRAGKLILPTCEAADARIPALLENAKANGVRAELLDERGILEVEPYARPWRRGVYVPDSVVIDSPEIVRRLWEFLEARGVRFFFHQRVTAVLDGQASVRTPTERFSFGHLINCAGAHADVLAHRMGFGLAYRLVPFKGIYFKVRREREGIVRGNLYPVPDPELPFLGIHFTRDVRGSVSVGPTAIPALGRENYGVVRGMRAGETLRIGWRLARMYLENGSRFRERVHAETAKYRPARFLEAARRLVPSLERVDLMRSESVGIRPQLVDIRTHRLVTDFMIERGDRSTHVLNTISPGLTCAFPFAEYLVEGLG